MMIKTAATPRCIECGSADISEYLVDGPTGVYAPDGGAEYRSELLVQCHECGAREQETAAYPELDQLDEMLCAFWDAPDPEPPAEIIHQLRRSGVLAPEAAA